MRTHFVIHESFEAPAALEAWCQSRSHTISFSRVYRNEALPNPGEVDLLFVMGGPQSPTTTTSECPHFDAQAEIALIQHVVRRGGLVLGVCLGAQLLGAAFGGHVEHSPHREIGVFRMTLTEEGKKDPILRRFPESFECGHWHGDMPGITTEAKILATSAGCPRQIVRYSPKAYGFQCHFEFTPDAIEGMIANSQAELARHQGLPYVQSVEELRTHSYSEMNSLLYTFLDTWISHESTG